MDHTFVIPVYGAAVRLGALIESLQAQTVRTRIELASSTPTRELEDIAARFALPLHINPKRIDIAADWNFALQQATTDFVTLAHQDDLFSPGYADELAGVLRRRPDAAFAFCDYSEHTVGGPRPINANLRIKRALCFRAFGFRESISETRDKVRLLSLGNPVCCPSVMFNRTVLGEFRFPGGFQTNLDWMAWLQLARRPGAFAYVRKCLLSKGVHADSETTASIASRARQREDRAIFEELWPRPVSAVLARLYQLGYRANRS